MIRRFLIPVVLIAAAGLPLAALSFATGDPGLDATLTSINVQAQASLGPFTADLSASFGVAQPQIQTWMTVDRMQPAEVYLALELGRIASKPPATVIETWRKNKGKGWGVVARELGIKPGSPGFKALKSSAAEKNKKIKARKGK